MNKKYIALKDNVEAFLEELRSVMTSVNFNVNTDLDILMKKKKESSLDPYTTENTLIALEFDRYDVYNQLLSLGISNYLETIIDNRDTMQLPFFAFIKQIQGRDVYIKVKIRNLAKKNVFCVSFHFARYPSKLPYARKEYI